MAYDDDERQSDDRDKDIPDDVLGELNEEEDEDEDEPDGFSGSEDEKWE